MSLPSCFNLLNLAYFENLLNNMSGVATENELQDLVNTVYNDLSTLQSTITSQVTYIDAMLALLTPPTVNLSEVVTWITSYITNVLTPLTTPYANMVAQLAALTTQVAAIQAKIEEIESLKGWTITIPSYSIICQL